MTSTFQRARRPEQKAERTAQILDAAEELLAETLDSSALSLSSLARRAGMAKSNVYRYFESRESVLLALLEAAMRRWTTEVVATLTALDRAPARGARLEAMVGAIAANTAARPAMCHLMSVMPSVLEHNVSFETVRDFKLETVALVGELTAAMHELVPELAPEQHARLLHHGLALIIGGWPLARPSETARAVLEETEALAPFRHELEPDLYEAVLLMAQGMLLDDSTSDR